eukprot:5006469-Alexandrium_andersonii.AAC.1
MARRWVRCCSGTYWQDCWPVKGLAGRCTRRPMLAGRCLRPESRIAHAQTSVGGPNTRVDIRMGARPWMHEGARSRGNPVAGLRVRTDDDHP